jgi:hypothetical protein
MALFVFGTLLYGQDTIGVNPAFPDLVHFPNVRDLALTGSGTEAYFTAQSPLQEISVLMKIVKKGKEWSAPEILSFSGIYEDMEPFLSPDGLHLYFASNRPLDTTGGPKDFDIWYVERPDLGSPWGTPINVGAPINTEQNEFYPSVGDNRNLYYTSDGPGSKGKDDIFRSEWAVDHYSAPVSLGEQINTEGYEFNAYVAPDESFLLFTAYQREDGIGSGDLYLSFRNDQGNWDTAISLGPSVNSKGMDYCPFVDLNGKTLYFTSKRSSIQKNGGFTTVQELLQEINRYGNGFSRIYKVYFDPMALKNRK